MDPQECFYAFVGAAEDGEFNLAADAAENYNEWIESGGYCAKDKDANVIRCDVEQDRYLVDDGGIERWRAAIRGIRI